MNGPRGEQSKLCPRRTFLHQLAAASSLGLVASPSAVAAPGDPALHLGVTLPSALQLYRDAATDLPVLRLTDPAFTSRLPPPNATALSRRGDFLVFTSDISGSMQVHRLDFQKALKKQGSDSAELRQWTGATRLNPLAVTLLPSGRSFLYADDRVLYTATFTGARPAEVYRCSEEFDIAGGGISVTSDGLTAAFVERRDAAGASRNVRRRFGLRLLNLQTRSSTLLGDADEDLTDPMVRPRRASVLYRRSGGLFLANFDGQQNYRLKLAEGETRAARWSPDGRSVLYLNVPPDPTKLVNIREFIPDTNQDRPVADTSQFAAFDSNGDASVFVGAGGTQVSPYIMLLVRAVRRELAVCEHRASDPAMAAPLFSPNSQQVFFTSDLHGKPAIYRMDVDKLVEQTKAEESSLDVQKNRVRPKNSSPPEHR